MAKPKPKIVFLDTQQFDARNLSFSHRHFERLLELVESGLAKVLVTEVVVGEVRRHIREKLAEARTRLGKDFSGLFKNLTKAPRPPVFDEAYWSEAETEVLSVFQDCLRRLRATTIPIVPEHVKPVFEWYFNYESPFDKHKRKAEFADAFSIAAVKDWAERHDEHVLAVTGDAAFSVAENASRLTHLKTIDEFFEAFPDPEITGPLKAAFEDFLDDEANSQWGEEEFQKLDFYVEDLGWPVDEVTVLYTEAHKLHVIEAAGGHAVISGRLYVHFNAHLPDQSIDVEDDTAFVDAEIHIDYDENDLSQIKPTSVTFERWMDVEVRLPAKYREAL